MHAWAATCLLGLLFYSYYSITSWSAAETIPRATYYYVVAKAVRIQSQCRPSPASCFLSCFLLLSPSFRNAYSMATEVPHLMAILNRLWLGYVLSLTYKANVLSGMHQTQMSLKLRCECHTARFLCVIWIAPDTMNISAILPCRSVAQTRREAHLPLPNTPATLSS
jgi:hypothetical protein